MATGKVALVFTDLRKEDVCAMTKRFILINKLNVFGWTDNNQVWEVGKARWGTAIYQAEKAMQILQHPAFTRS